MEEESVEGKCAIQVREPDPEIGAARIVTRVRKVVEQSLAGHFMFVIEEIAKDAKKGKLPQVKFMMDFLRRLEAEEELPREEYESFAAVLWKECQRLENEEQGIGNRE